MLPPLAALSVGAGPDRVDASSWRRAPPGWRRPPPSQPSVPVTKVSKSFLRAELLVHESGIAPGQPGLYASTDIAEGTLVCIYTFDRIVGEETLDGTQSDATRRYAVAAPDPRFTLVLDLPVDPARHPAAMANEPAEGSVANMEMRGEDVAMDDGDVFNILGLYTCTAVKARTELTWFYGETYTPIREKEEYEAGEGCIAKGELKPTLESIARAIWAKGNVAGLLAPVHAASSSESQESSQGYVPPPRRQKTTG